MPLSRLEAFGEAIRQVRNRRDLKQEETSMKIGMDRAYLGHIERGSQNTTLDTAWRIADTLGVKLSELVTLAEQLEERR